MIFTYRIGINDWKRIGIADREMSYYELFPKNYNFGLLTYDRYIGKKTFKKYSKFKFIYNKYKLPSFLYSIIVPVLFMRKIKNYDVIKTNQLWGAWIAILIRLLDPSKKIIIRAGFIWRDHKLSENKLVHVLRKVTMKLIIPILLKYCHKLFLASNEDLNYLKNNYNNKHLNNKSVILFNGVDVEKYEFKYQKYNFNQGLRIVSIGRLVYMKNIQSVITALNYLDNDIQYTIVGTGPFETKLRKISAKYNLKINFLGNIFNDEIPNILVDNDLIIIPQLYGSGISKVMLEAMACGTIVIGSKIEPHEILIKHQESGYLCGFKAKHIKETIQEVISTNHDALARISLNARKIVEQKYSMQSMINKEDLIYESILSLKEK